MAGGFGTRLRPLTINLPKPMVAIGTRPMMEHVVALLKSHGFTDITCLLYFQPEHITSYFRQGEELGVRIQYVRPDDDFGTAGAVRFALKDPKETTLVISGDLVTTFDLTAALAWHRAKQSEATLLLTRAENPLAYGIVITNDEGQIVRFLEKPTWGEAFSDTINTGIYLLEPSAVEQIPTETNFDFSQNLFPLMLQKQMALYGMIMPGYWKDVGTIGEYHRAHADLLMGQLQLSLPHTREERNGAVVYLGNKVRLADDVRFEGTVIVGNDVSVESGTTLSSCSIGDRVWVGRNCEIRNSVVWEDSFLGNQTLLTGAIVCHRVRLGDRVQMYDSAIVSDDCQIGQGATIRSDCKIWPNKTVDDGAIVSRSLVWGEKWTRELFTDSKVTGLAMTELTPEMTVRLGSAFGAMLGPGAAVVTSRDASDVSRLLRRGLISGLLSAGVNVTDLETLPVPVMRFSLSRRSYQAGVYVRHNPDDYRQVDFIFFDGSGLDMPTGKLKKIERNYFGEDYDLASLDRIGHLAVPPRLIDDYRSAFMEAIDTGAIRGGEFNIVIDYSNGSSSQIFPTLYSELGITTTELNSSLNPRKFSRSAEDEAIAIHRLSAIVTSLKAQIGFLLNPAAEKLTVIDETGHPIDSQTLLLIVTELYLRTMQPKKIAVTVGASMGVEEIAERYGAQVIRVANDHRAMMEARMSGKAEFVGGTRGGFIFPGFQMGADAILATVRMLELLAKSETRLSELRAQFVHLNRQTTSVPCPWSLKGTVMRRLITDSHEKNRQLIDGVRVFENDGWVLVTPDRYRAAFTILAESRSASDTYSLMNRYRELVLESQRN